MYVCVNGEGASCSGHPSPLSPACSNFRFFAGQIRHQDGDSHAMADAINYTVHQPLGVCGLITPWNLPLYLLSWKVRQ